MKVICFFLSLINVPTLQRKIKKKQYNLLSDSNNYFYQKYTQYNAIASTKYKEENVIDEVTGQCSNELFDEFRYPWHWHKIYYLEDKWGKGRVVFDFGASEPIKVKYARQKSTDKSGNGVVHQIQLAPVAVQIDHDYVFQ